MAEALGWGVVAASALVLGAALAVARKTPWSDLPMGLVLAFGAGALFSAVSFELAQEGVVVGGPRAVGNGLALGALVFYLLSGVVERDSNVPEQGTGATFALGALIDGIPEQLVLGIGLAGGEGVSISLLLAIYVSNMPESIGSAGDLRAEGRENGWILRLWITVAALCAIATPIGYGLADITSDEFRAAINGFAAGGLLVLLVDTMIPEARTKGGRVAGVVTVLGFALAAGLSSVS